MLSCSRRHDEAHPLYDEAREIYAGLDDEDGVARLENGMGLDAFLRGDIAEARQRFQITLEMARTAAHLDRIQTALGNLSHLDVIEAAPAAARGRLRESLPINRQLGNLYGIAHQLPTLAETFRLEGDAPKAARLIGAADALLEETGAALEALERAVYERATEALRAEMGETTFESERRAGLAIPWEEDPRASRPCSLRRAARPGAA